MLHKLLLFVVSFSVTLQAQEFIPHGELLQPNNVKYTSAKKIETEKTARYSTGKDGIPTGKALKKTTARYSARGLPVAVTITDSTGSIVDSFYYSGKGSVERIVRFRLTSDSTSTPTERIYFNRDTSGHTGEAHIYDIASATITTAFRYFYNKAGKLVSIHRIVSADTSITDSLSWHFDKNERLILRSEGKNKIEYKYDQAGNLLEMKEFAGKTAGKTTKYSYDNNRRPVKVTTSGKGFNSVSEYLYNKNGVLILIKTKTDRGVKGSETYFTELKEVSFYK